MNTIPTIFNEDITPYTAVGGKEHSASTGISAVILNRPGYQTRTILNDIEKTGFDNIISIESSNVRYNIEELSIRFPSIRFILPEKELNLGEQINLAASELESPLFYVLRSEMKIIAGGIAPRMAERLSVDEDGNTAGKDTGFKRICTVPVIINSNYEVIPTLIYPVTKKNKMSRTFKMRTMCFEPKQDDQFTLYPFDGIGIYDRKRFINIGGYDSTISTPYWQLMDFGFRSFLWGDEIALNNHFKLSYNEEPPAQDYSVNSHYGRFYIKNLAPVYKKYKAAVPFTAFFSYLFSSGEDIITAFKEFKEGKNWVAKNKLRWRRNVSEVITLLDSFGFAPDSEEKPIVRENADNKSFGE